MKTPTELNRRDFLGISASAIAGGLLSSAPALAESPAPQPDPIAPADRWSEAKANAWYARHPWPAGSNYIPRNAINQLEMWQAATFDPKEIDSELALAQGLGMTTMRVFLHDLLWQQDSEGFKQRIDTFLTIAAKHHVRPLLVLFDSCWDPCPKLGPQHPPIPGVHNSGWVQSPGREGLMNASEYPRLKTYVQGVVGAFANDSRIFGWDIWNEPDNGGGGDYASEEPKDKNTLVINLLPQAFAWARAMHPTQPLTSGIWHGDWSSFQTLPPAAKIQIRNSDFISFHNYGWPEDFEQCIRNLQQYRRPIVCTEYMARGNGSLFDLNMPIARRHNVGAINWGFVNGKTQTNLPWNSWQRPYVLEQPTIWFHDIFHPDHTPYREREIQIIRTATGVQK